MPSDEINLAELYLLKTVRPRLLINSLGPVTALSGSREGVGIAPGGDGCPASIPAIAKAESFKRFCCGMTVFGGECLRCAGCRRLWFRQSNSQHVNNTV
ncbi:carbamoyl-phosphate synthase large subunit [Anopheles sinensis]|uniref:Carbamoyl-phosphate synthase large subunit n=1 Tax=Anopheles sinensis TaxID=74873 RepID=A0A084VJK7_ANOSI|nr:carbamoyl-phosphate synthase large subunit [Anopheles sinensis]